MKYTPIKKWISWNITVAKSFYCQIWYELNNGKR